MNILSSLSPKSGSKHSRKRLGRGKGSGLGQTSGKGGKGQTARSGGSIRRGFEGGQTPLMRRLPKFGFNNTDFELKYSVVNLSQIDKIGKDLTPELMVEIGLVHKLPVKVLAVGEITKPLSISANKFSKMAIEKLNKAGGKAEVIK